MKATLILLNPRFNNQLEPPFQYPGVNWGPPPKPVTPQFLTMKKMHQPKQPHISQTQWKQFYFQLFHRVNTVAVQKKSNNTFNFVASFGAKKFIKMTVIQLDGKYPNLKQVWQTMTNPLQFILKKCWYQHFWLSSTFQLTSQFYKTIKPAVL